MSEINWNPAGGQDEAERRTRTEAQEADRRPHPTTKAVDTIQGWKTEIAESYVTMQEFNTMDPVSVFQNLSQFSARASEMRSRIGTTASKDWQNFRIRIIDPFIEECDRQFKLHSRITAIQEMDARLAGGRFT